MAQPQKKMNVTQLTFIVAVNMMGSGIIMLPSNMAQVGAISLLSWIVTAIGSMAIAYGFAQAGIFNTRPGGLQAYAEDAYGKAGYFQAFFLYFLSLAIANVAVAISAVGYLAAFFPGLSATPVATCITVIALLWLTTVANFGGPSITGKIGSVTVWGVILPVGLISIVGWFWFKPDVFAAAWNPKGISLLEGIGSSISLTLWAFLGMESAAQNSAAVENPKRDVPLACLFGTLGAAVVYILSTSVIQGIVPNADLAKSTGPFGLAYAQMFSPLVGQVVMGLAVMACLGSLLGWQFTLAQVGKAAADDRMFPALFSRVNKLDAPIAGMVVMGVVQTLMALMTISPDLNKQFGALVNLAVVTNVLPYIIALSALPVIMQNAKVPQRTYRLNFVIAVVAMAYSTFSLYTSGKDAVMGGMLVMAVGFIIWAFIAPRFAAVSASADAGLRMPARAAQAAALLAALLVGAALLPPGAHAQIVEPGGRLTIGYHADARPFSYDNESGKPTGYAVELCQKVVELAKGEVNLSAEQIQWVRVTTQDRLQMLKEGKVKLLCGEPVTLSARKEVSFSIPIFQGGLGALVRADAPAGLVRSLSERPAPSGPLWRGTPTEGVLQAQTVAVVGGTPSEKVVADRLAKLQLATRVAPVKEFPQGVQAVVDRKANVFFADRSLLLDAVKRSPAFADLRVMDRRFTQAPVAIALARGNENARLAVDRALSHIYATDQFRAAYVKWFGEPDADTVTFFRLSALPE
jgi:putrescine:ornithine antiporter